MRAFVSFVNAKVAERPSQRNLFFPAFSPFSQKRPTAAVLQTPFGHVCVMRTKDISFIDILISFNA